MVLVKFSGTANFVKLLIQHDYRSTARLGVLWGVWHLSELGQVSLGYLKLIILYQFSLYS